MEPESVISLFDSLWFNHEFFKKHTNPSSPSSSDPNHAHKTQDRREAEKGKPHCKSISELEFEELKGFKDLGFEFSEEDANSSLVDIIPGLQKLMKNSCEQTESYHPKAVYCKSRPYLSEAWEVMEKKRRRRRSKKALAKWKIPEISNEVELKHNLRRWAHTVASAF